MNERIKELYKQAGISFKPMVIEDVEYTYNHVSFNDFFLGDEKACVEKLVELVVKECADYVKNSSAFTYASQADVCAEKLLKRFGVE